MTETLSSEELHYDEDWEPTHPATTARTWTDAFAWTMISGLIWDRDRVIGPLLREDYAPAIRDGVPYSKRESVSDPADLAEMDALCGYLNVVQGAIPAHFRGRCRWASRMLPSGRARPNSSMRPGH
ncbi:hypothetical protein [Streptomyces sp. LN245]|uniref:hypothetical protein n=1 Tax=Streptomyces sp. LN245 TaxID=3112975 RepID=UPI00371CD951